MSLQQRYQANLLLPLEIVLTTEKLIAFNQIWDLLYLVDINFEGPYKAMPSILSQLRETMIKKAMNRGFSITKKPNFKLKIKPYEAVFLEVYIYTVIDHLPSGHSITVARRIASEINQKLA